MVISSGCSAAQDHNHADVLWEDGERAFCREWQGDAEKRTERIVVLPTAEPATPGDINRLTHEYELRDLLDCAWALRPLELVSEHGRTMLRLAFFGGEPLDRLVGSPMETGQFLRFAIALAAGLRELHGRGLVHKDIKPSNVVVDASTGKVWLTGFGIASRLRRERQAPEPPEFIAGTLAYMAPEQTGRMNRSIDSRSDLYALGVTFYQMLTGALPFTATDPMEWVHCHIAQTPAPPSARVETIPPQVSRIVSKLLAKTAEKRYQTASGIERDLKRCLDDWHAKGRIDPFEPGERDTSDQLLTLERLFGRDREVATLHAAFDRCSTSGAPELILVSGYAGVGKSSVVNELHKVLVPRGLFATGKFDEHKRDIPYATLGQAFQGLISLLLSKSDAELEGWRTALQEALGENGQIMIELVPELRLIIGDQPPVLDLPAQEAQRRFQLVFRRFVGVFAQPEHPLALFLDDLQWLDAATLDLVEDLLTRSDALHLLLIGAYRDNEVDAAHPLRRKLEVMRKAGVRMEQITLAPLGREHVEQLISDALSCKPAHAMPLAQLIHEKTAGNPFFMIRFLSALVDEGLVAFDHGAQEWSWDLGRIRAKGYTDNVADLMVGKISRLPSEVHSALQQLSCLGDSAETSMLTTVLSASEKEVHTVLWEAVRQDLVEQSDGSYRFTHDRVREAAYASLSEEQRTVAHLRIGRLLVAQMPAEKQEEAIFEIVNQLNRGSALIGAGLERQQLAELNLKAGRRAQASTAYASALKYFEAGRTLLAADCWERQHGLTFALELYRAECEFLTGASADAETRLATLSGHAVDGIERAAVTCLQIDVYLTRNQGGLAIEVALEYLRHVGIRWSAQPTEREARRAYEHVWTDLSRRTDDELIALPLMDDATSRATLDVLTKLTPPAFFFDVNLFSLAVCQVVALTLAHGNCDASPAAYVRLGVIAGSRFGDYQGAYRVGKIGCDLVERRGLRRHQGAAYVNFASLVMPWTRHVKAGRDVLRRAFHVASAAGDLTYVAFNSLQMSVTMLSSGDPLPEVQAEIENAIAYAQKVQFLPVIVFLETNLAPVRTLRGLTWKFGSFDDGRFDERQMESRFAHDPHLAAAEFWYWVRKLQARFLAGDYATALDAAGKARGLLKKSVTTLEAVDYHFYSALCHAASCNSLPVDRDSDHIDALTAHHRQLELWAAGCPENFETHAALVGAEVARLSGRELDAEHLYERSIRSARASEFVQNEALANELASRFYAARGFEVIARAYLLEARQAYVRWGADAKVRQLDGVPSLSREDIRAPALSATIRTPLDTLDLATVIKMSRAISSEIMLDNLLEILIRMAIQQAGAERGVFIVPYGAEPRILAEATATGDTVAVQLRDAPATEAVLPQSVLQYVLRRREPVILDNAGTQHPFAVDPYIRDRQARSILCLPLLTQTKLSGVLYLENNLASGVFVAGRTAVLRMLASQAAVALENARLYRDLAEREARIRRLVDANIIGTFIWKFDETGLGVEDPLIIDANDAFLRMVGYDRSDLAPGITRFAASPPEWRERDIAAFDEMKKNGTTLPFEKEFWRKDGSRVPVLVGFGAFDERRVEGLAFVVDLTALKQAEAETRDIERRYREAQAVLAHAGRIATIGQITASIAHEVSQPVAGAITNAQTALRWLSAETPDVGEAVQAVKRILRDGNRAREVINRIRALVKKGPPRKDPVEMNGAIQEVIDLTRGEAARSAISVQTDFAEGLPIVQGDFVQLQQVILNLIVNAIEAMRDGSEGPRKLLITTREAGPDEVLVGVGDSGPGLAEPASDRIFDAFHTTKPGGLGLGLSICRSIIEAHGGRLWVTANAPRGALFQFTVPAKRAGD